MKVPKIRFPEFIESYTQYRLGDISKQEKKKEMQIFPCCQCQFIQEYRMEN